LARRARSSARDCALLEAEEQKLEALRAALIEGEESGPAEPFDFDEFIAEMKRKPRKSA